MVQLVARIQCQSRRRNGAPCWPSTTGRQTGSRGHGRSGRVRAARLRWPLVAATPRTSMTDTEAECAWQRSRLPQSRIESAMELEARDVQRVDGDHQWLPTSPKTASTARRFWPRAPPRRSAREQKSSSSIPTSALNAWGRTTTMPARRCVHAHVACRILRSPTARSVKGALRGRHPACGSDSV